MTPWPTIGLIVLVTNTGSTPIQALILGLCCDSYTYINFVITPILNVQLHSRDCFECNCLLIFKET